MAPNPSYSGNLEQLALKGLMYKALVIKLARRRGTLHRNCHVLAVNFLNQKSCDVYEYSKDTEVQWT